MRALRAGLVGLAVVALATLSPAAFGPDVDAARAALTELEQASDALYEALRAQLEEAERWPPRGSEEDAWLDVERIEEAGDELAERYRDDDAFEGIGNELLHAGQAVDRLSWITRLVRFDEETVAALGRVTAARRSLDALFAEHVARAREERDVWIARRLTGSQERRLSKALEQIAEGLPALAPHATDEARVGTPDEVWDETREPAPDEASERSGGAGASDEEEGVSAAQELTEAEPARVVRPGSGEMDVPIRDEERARRADARLGEELARFVLVARDVVAAPRDAADGAVARFQARTLMRIARDLDRRIRGAGARADDALGDAWRRLVPPLEDMARIHKLEPPGP
jgi:hypothetical protein